MQTPNLFDISGSKNKKNTESTSIDPDTAIFKDAGKITGSETLLGSLSVMITKDIFNKKSGSLPLFGEQNYLVNYIFVYLRLSFSTNWTLCGPVVAALGKELDSSLGSELACSLG